MSSISTAPFPYKNAITDRLSAERGYDSGLMEYWNGRSLRPLTDETFVTWRLLEPLLVGIEQIAKREDWLDSFNTVARLEFFWDQEEEHRGVVLFDTQGRLIVHVLHALLGYGGSGPGLSGQIMTHLGVPIETFDEIQREVWNQRPYKVVISREKHDVIHGVDTAYPTLDVESEWSWWRVR